MVYLPSCASRTMGQQSDAGDQRPSTEVTMSYLTKPDLRLFFRRSFSDDQCCGMPYDKGMSYLAQSKATTRRSVVASESSG
ncbi:hypothetical protein OK016_28805 [Vibrio chagasii]|nr:hypothetical protein [Vibrio chagasii]